MEDRVKLGALLAGAAVTGSALTFLALQPRMRRKGGRNSGPRSVELLEGLEVETAAGRGGTAASTSGRAGSGPPPLPPAWWPTTSAARADPHDPRPRTDHLSWDDYFMALAFLSSQRSKDPAKQVGAVIIDSRKIIAGIGYNGFPRGCGDRELPWSKSSRDGDPLQTKYPYVVHAETNAILNTNAADVRGSCLYVTLFPCNECAKLLIQAGISEVVFHEGKVEEAVGGEQGPGEPEGEPAGEWGEREERGPPRGASDAPAFPSSKASRRAQYQASRRMLAMAGVKVRQHQFAFAWRGGEAGS